MPTTPITKREPAMLAATVLAIVLGAGGFLTAWGTGTDWRVALGGALTAAALSLGAGGYVRSQVYSPATADQIMDAHAVIEAAERRGQG